MTLGIKYDKLTVVLFLGILRSDQENPASYVTHRKQVGLDQGWYFTIQCSTYFMSFFYKYINYITKYQDIIFKDVSILILASAILAYQHFFSYRHIAYQQVIPLPI